MTIHYQTARDMIVQISIAYRSQDIRAVSWLSIALVHGSDTESVLYFRTGQASNKKTVVTVVESMAASGAYYMAVGSMDYITRQPSSEVGNIGVIGTIVLRRPADN